MVSQNYHNCHTHGQYIHAFVSIFHNSEFACMSSWIPRKIKESWSAAWCAIRCIDRDREIRPPDCCNCSWSHIIVTVTVRVYFEWVVQYKARVVNKWTADIGLFVIRKSYVSIYRCGHMSKKHWRSKNKAFPPPWWCEAASESDQTQGCNTRMWFYFLKLKSK